LCSDPCDPRFGVARKVLDECTRGSRIALARIVPVYDLDADKDADCHDDEVGSTFWSSATVRPLRETKQEPSGGSTDVGDVSYLVPTIRLGAPIAGKDVPWYSGAVVAATAGFRAIDYVARDALFPTKPFRPFAAPTCLDSPV